MAISKVVRVKDLRSKNPARTMVFDGHTYTYQCAFMHKSSADDALDKFRKEGLFARMVKHQVMSKTPKGGNYVPWYFIYIRPMKSKTPPSWYRG